MRVGSNFLLGALVARLALSLCFTVALAGIHKALTGPDRMARWYPWALASILIALTAQIAARGQITVGW